MAPDKVIDFTQFIEQTATEFGANPDMVRKIAWTMFSTYLARECRRHEQDIVRGKKEVKHLEKKGYPALYISPSTWIDMPR